MGTPRPRLSLPLPDLASRRRDIAHCWLSSARAASPRPPRASAASGEAAAGRQDEASAWGCVIDTTAGSNVDCSFSEVRPEPKPLRLAGNALHGQPPSLLLVASCESSSIGVDGLASLRGEVFRFSGSGA